MNEVSKCGPSPPSWRTAAIFANTVRCQGGTSAETPIDLHFNMCSNGIICNGASFFRQDKEVKMTTTHRQRQRYPAEYSRFWDCQGRATIHHCGALGQASADFLQQLNTENATCRKWKWCLPWNGWPQQARSADIAGCQVGYRHLLTVFAFRHSQIT